MRSAQGSRRRRPLLPAGLLLLRDDRTDSGAAAGKLLLGDGESEASFSESRQQPLEVQLIVSSHDSQDAAPLVSFTPNEGTAKAGDAASYSFLTVLCMKSLFLSSSSSRLIKHKTVCLSVAS